MAEPHNEADEWKTIMFLYNSALKQVNAKIEILNEEFINVHNYNPIEHVKTRIKSAESIVKKLKKQGHDVTIENMVRYVHDIAGIRIICSFTSDIYKIADMISNQNDVRVLIIKNYIDNPKPNGYKSYHMVVSVPIYLSDGPVETKVEIQIRTIAMDFWASLEHKIYYKYEGNAPDHIQNELFECATMINMLDNRMFLLNEEIKKNDAKKASLQEAAEPVRSPGRAAYS
ncbi:MAG: GTP pyrophosphokinase family protein [Lachnospiraceae bacterium]|nr:GTP pyrophosphokinase family protein [Lachnospiraceae bacterium]MBR5659356.1 GTP pyrophosphokinase family protein [Lachnospiraceae bacterium]